MDDNNDTTASCEVATHAERQESVGKGIPDDVQPDAPQFAEADDVMTTNHSDVSSEAEEALDNEIKTEDNGSNEDATAGHTQSKQDEKDDGLNAGVDKGSELTPADTSDKPFSIFTPNEKKFIMLCAGICAFFSPVSGQIYFPSLGAIARDLDVSYDLVTLTITTYLVCDVLNTMILQAMLTTRRSCKGLHPPSSAAFLTMRAVGQRIWPASPSI